MWLRSAAALCPSLVLLPYDFEGIQKASEGLFKAVLELSHRLAPVSCDEVRPLGAQNLGFRVQGVGRRV